jgi:hypothetical protein
MGAPRRGFRTVPYSATRSFAAHPFKVYSGTFED